MKLLTYYNTLKHLKFEQLYFRVLKKLIHPKVNNLSISKLPPSGVWQVIDLYKPKLIDSEKVIFLNKSGYVRSANDWNNDNNAKLWLYNLHYFDDLNSLGSKERRVLQGHWVSRWVKDNPAEDKGNGWEAYTLSLRIVNWTKAFLSVLEYDQTMLDSLAQQADFLSQDLERHLLGNHLFVNAKALIFAGCFFESKEADEWLKIGLSIYNKELTEQVLEDGGNYELTPMYHVIMLIDLLDLLNLFNAYPNKVSNSIVEQTKVVALKMLIWLERMSHNDNKISFFNDTAFGIAPENDVVFGYAKALGLKWKSDDLTRLQVHDLVETGYVSVKNSEFSLICDLANVGPDYQPGHAHADTLSFEWCLGANRVFVNSGISEYGVSEERLRQRKLAAHNTVTVNDLDSSQVWSGFRVAKRAKIVERQILNDDGTLKFFAVHDGFSKQGVKCLHKRNWKVNDNLIEITDELVGNFQKAVGYLHLHPDVQILSFSESKIVLKADDFKVDVKIDGALVNIEDTSWHPEFGKVISNKKIKLTFKQNVVSTIITWKKNS